MTDSTVGGSTFARPRITAEHRPDGTILLGSATELGPHDDHLWVNQAEARSVCGRTGDVAVDDPALLAHLEDVLATLGGRTGSAGRVRSRPVPSAPRLSR